MTNLKSVMKGNVTERRTYSTVETKITRSEVNCKTNELINQRGYYAVKNAIIVCLASTNKQYLNNKILF